MFSESEDKQQSVATPAAGASQEISPQQISKKNDGETKDEPNSSTIKWSDEQALLLIRLIETNYNKFNSGLKKNVWHLISKEIRQTCNLAVTGEQCDSKWKGLKKTYKKIKDHNNKTGNSPQKWPFFAAIDSFLSTKPEVNPVATCSTQSNKVDSIHGSTEEREDDFLKATATKGKF